ncbi:MAG: hypothetical protein MK095_00170 [Phycisphaerales bacterium]|jgi:hypothetical protein|nr:hypothetical protein [Phycisphaerales bacterium]
MTSFQTHVSTRLDGQPIPFPVHRIEHSNIDRGHDGLPDTLRSLGLTDRRMLQLARALGCLGHFDSEDDDPRAA